MGKRLTDEVVRLITFRPLEGGAETVDGSGGSLAGRTFTDGAADAAITDELGATDELGTS